MPDRSMQAGTLLIGGSFNGLALADSREIFARSLKFWLKQRGLSGAELARRLSDRGFVVTRAAVSHWLREVSGPDLLTIGEVADILSIPQWYLLYSGEAQTLPDGTKTPGPSTDKAEEFLKFIADKLGKRIRISNKPEDS